MTSAASEMGRALAARRPRTTITCEVCGTEKEVWERQTQKPRTCSPKCRIKLYRQERKKQEATMPKPSEWKAAHVMCQGAVDDVRSHYEAENERLRAALDKAVGQFGHLSTVLGLSNKPLHAKDALKWSEEARAAPVSGRPRTHFLKHSGGMMTADVTRLDFIDFPMGFELQDELPPEAHHPKCSQPVMLCDCGAIIKLWRKLRAEAGLPDDDGSYGFTD